MILWLFRCCSSLRWRRDCRCIHCFLCCVSQGGFSSRQMDRFHSSARRSLPLNLPSITSTETGRCCQTPHWHMTFRGLISTTASRHREKVSAGLRRRTFWKMWKLIEIPKIKMVWSDTKWTSDQLKKLHKLLGVVNGILSLRNSWWNKTFFFPCINYSMCWLSFTATVNNWMVVFLDSEWFDSFHKLIIAHQRVYFDFNSVYIQYIRGIVAGFLGLYIGKNIKCHDKKKVKKKTVP